MLLISIEMVSLVLDAMVTSCAVGHFTSSAKTFYKFLLIAIITVVKQNSVFLLDEKGLLVNK